jgi:hypothetical protein
MPTTTSPATSRGEGFRNRWSIAFLHAPSPPSTTPQAEGVFRVNRFRSQPCRGLIAPASLGGARPYFDFGLICPARLRAR